MWNDYWEYPVNLSVADGGSSAGARAGTQLTHIQRNVGCCWPTTERACWLIAVGSADIDDDLELLQN